VPNNESTKPTNILNIELALGSSYWCFFFEIPRYRRLSLMPARSSGRVNKDDSNEGLKFDMQIVASEKSGFY
jgi:hypothetical protein